MDEPNWKEIAMALGQRVNFAIAHLDAKGAGVLANIEKPASEWQHWRDYMADAMEMLPGVKVDREMLHTLNLPRSKRAKAQAEILKKRETPSNVKWTAYAPPILSLRRPFWIERWDQGIAGIEQILVSDASSPG